MGAEPPQPAWRAAIDADRRKRPRRLSSERAALRQLTSAMLVAAVGLNLALFVQTGAESVGLGGLQDAIEAFANALFPGAGPRPASSPPTSVPPGTQPVATTHPS